MPPIAMAQLSQDETGDIYAEIETDQPIDGLYPYLGGQLLNRESVLLVTQAAVGIGPNTDTRIKAIGRGVQ